MGEGLNTRDFSSLKGTIKVRPRTDKETTFKNVTLENKLTGPDKRCFVSLIDILNTSLLKFGDTIYCKTPSNTFVPICNFNKPISVT